MITPIVELESTPQLSKEELWGLLAYGINSMPLPPIQKGAVREVNLYIKSRLDDLKNKGVISKSRGASFYCNPTTREGVLDVW